MVLLLMFLLLPPIPYLHPPSVSPSLPPHPPSPPPPPLPPLFLCHPLLLFLLLLLLRPLLFLLFLTEQFDKLVKIRRDQTSLPISQYRSHILTAVQAHQVILIAGDTGCGKSTQVRRRRRRREEEKEGERKEEEEEEGGGKEEEEKE